MGLLMWWRGPRGPIHFEEFRGEESTGHGLGGISLRERHPEDSQEIRCVLWLPEADVEYVVQREVGGRQVEAAPVVEAGGPRQLVPIRTNRVLRIRFVGQSLVPSQFGVLLV